MPEVEQRSINSSSELTNSCTLEKIFKFVLLVIIWLTGMMSLPVAELHRQLFQQQEKQAGTRTFFGLCSDKGDKKPLTDSPIVSLGVPILSMVTALHLAVLSGFVLTVELRKRQEGASTHEVQNLALSVSTVILGSVQLLVSVYSLIGRDERLKVWSITTCVLGIALAVCSILAFTSNPTLSILFSTYTYMTALDGSFCLVMPLLLLLPVGDTAETEPVKE